MIKGSNLIAYFRRTWRAEDLGAKSDSLKSKLWRDQYLLRVEE